MATSLTRALAEPGLIEIFGKRYGGRPVMERHVFDALDDLALRPETAAHLAGKLARHFVSDDPDPQLVAHMQAVYLASGGNLRALYRAMLEHPAAWAPELRKTRAPMLWVAASLRATGVTADQIRALSDRDTRRDLLGPLRAMGERWEAVPSPRRIRRQRARLDHGAGHGRADHMGDGAGGPFAPMPRTRVIS